MTRRQLVGGLASVAAIGGSAAIAGGRAARTDDRPRLVVAMLADHLPGLQPLLDEYAARADVSILPDPQPLDQLYTRVNISIIQGTKAHDVVSMVDTWLPEFVDGDWLAELDEAFADDQDRADFIPAQLALGAYPDERALTGIPWSGNVQVFARRRSVFAELNLEPPADWLGVLSCAAALSAAAPRTGLYAYGVRALGPADASLAHLPILRGLGRDVVDPRSLDSQLATPEAMQAIRGLVALARAAPPGFDAAGAAELASQMAMGQIAMTAELWTEQLFQLFDPAVSAVADDLVISSHPARRSIANQGVSGSWLLAVPKAGDNREQAIDLVRWLTAPRQQRRLLMNASVIPTRASAFRDAEVVDRWPFLAGVRDALARSRSRPRTRLYPAVEEIHGRHVRAALLGELDGAEAMRQAHLEIRALMVREGIIEE